MQGKEYNVRLGADIKHAGAEHTAALILAACAHGGKIRLRLGDGIVAAEAVRHVKNVIKPAVIVLKAHEHIDQDGLMAAGTQRAADLVAARERNITLHAQSTC